MMQTAVLLCPDREVLAARALDLLVDGLRAGIKRHGVAHLALTGGSSASALFELLANDARAQRVDWPRVHVWQGDERSVPLSHPDRNWATALREWLAADGAPAIPESQLHPIPCDAAIDAGHDVSWAAARYAEELEGTLPARGGVPAFDVVLLGVGGDGHILSTFPGTPAVNETRVPALAVAAPTHVEPNLPRVTIAPYLLQAAGSVVVMVPGAAKAGIIAECFGAYRDPDRWPAQLALRPNAVWLLEPGSAAELTGPAGRASRRGR
ncbi:MAG TPA: 6-phosphogluconolactonase [Anaerolineae bacterium]|jgi:6-phosphogluconolactonase|nr:6-phosphogluconolactonase [Anaerolineae bacterium]